MFCFEIKSLSISVDFILIKYNINNALETIVDKTIQKERRFLELF